MTMAGGDLDAIADPVNPYACERCGERDHAVRLWENGDPKRLGDSWRLMPLHPACFRQWQGEVDLRLLQPDLQLVDE